MGNLLAVPDCQEQSSLENYDSYAKSLVHVGHHKVFGFRFVGDITFLVDRGHG